MVSLICGIPFKSNLEYKIGGQGLGNREIGRSWHKFSAIRWVSSEDLM